MNRAGKVAPPIAPFCEMGTFTSDYGIIAGEI